jgi:hypothetical protein
MEGIGPTAILLTIFVSLITKPEGNADETKPSFCLGNS